MSDDHFENDNEKELFTPEVNEQENFTEELDMYSDAVNEDEIRRTGLFLTRIAARFEHVNEALERNDSIYVRRFGAEKEYQKRLTDAEHRDPEPEEGDYWARVTADALNDVYTSGFTDFARPGSDWRQVVHHEGHDLGAGEPRIASNKATSGENFLKLLSQKANTGTGVNVPLYHSGIWVRIETPSKIEISALRYQLGEQKVQLGMATKGSAFSAYTNTITMLAVDFALDHISKSNIQFVSPTDLKPLIRQADIPVLLWGMASAMYPRGFHYSFPCIADPECDHVSTKLVQLRRMKYEDVSRLTKKQRQHMARLFNRCTEEDLTAYCDDFEGHQSRRVWINDDIGVDLKMPSIFEYETASRDWIDGIVELSASQYNEPVDSERRAHKIERFATDTTACQYRHWVKTIVQRGDGEDEVLECTDSDIISSCLKVVFSDAEQSGPFIDAVEKYISDTKMTAIALRSFDCPKCSKTPDGALFHKRFPHLIEIDVVSDFFTLLALKQS